MKTLKKEQAITRRNGSACTVSEYPIEDQDINGAVVELSGRYPDHGRVMNDMCKELIFVVSGSGCAEIEGETVDLSEGSMLLLEPRERYFLDGNMRLFVPCAPAWYPEQHRAVA